MLTFSSPPGSENSYKDPYSRGEEQWDCRKIAHKFAREDQELLEEQKQEIKNQIAKWENELIMSKGD